MTVLLLLAGAVAAGLIGGFLGLGGGVILVPFLSLVLKLPMPEAVALSLATIMANSLVSSTQYIRKEMIDFRLVVLLSIFASLGAIAGSMMSDLIPENYLRIGFSLMLIYTTYSMLRKKDDGHPLQPGDIHLSFWKVSSIALLAGILSSLLGVGGGVIIVPAAYLLFNYPLDVSRGSSAFTIGIIATAGTIVYFARGILDVQYAGQIMLGTIAGGWMGSWLGTRAKAKSVKPVFSVLFIYLAIRMFLQGIS